MPENGFSSVNHSPKEDGSQINEHLDNMSIDELTDALTDMWDVQMTSHIQQLGWMSV